MSTSFFQIDGGRPCDRRGFVHRKLLRVAGGVISNLPVVGAPFRVARQAVSLVTRKSARATVDRSLTARSGPRSAREKDIGRHLKFAPEGQQSIASRARDFFTSAQESDCRIPGQRRDPGTGECAFFLGERRGPNGGRDVGEAVMGRYGAALEPGIMTIDRSVCLRGMQLGNDGLCYNKGAISNKQRMWPAGRKPLLTGGEMRAISQAASAAKRLQGANKRLQEIGLIKKPAPRRSAKPKTEIVVHDAHHHSDH